jgi:hypothetical protein
MIVSEMSRDSGMIGSYGILVIWRQVGDLAATIGLPLKNPKKKEGRKQR